VRFGGPVLGEGPAVLFRLAGAAPHPATASPRASAPAQPAEVSPPAEAGTVGAALALLAGVATAGGVALDPDTAAGLAQRLLERLERLDLPGPDPRRATAHLLWAAAAQPAPRRLKRRLAGLDDARRSALGSHLVAVATGAGHVGPAQMAALTAAFRALDLDPGQLFGQVHRATTAGPIPAEPAGVVTSRGHSGQAAVTSPAPGDLTRVELDPTRIRAKLAETAEVAAFLGGIFVDEDTPTPSDAQLPATAGAMPTQPSSTDDPAPDPVTGLDAAHSQLLRRLSTRPSWAREEVELLARALDLLPDGALDALNEAALDGSGEPVCEGDDPVEINSYALQDLLR
jgi:TerB-C domain